MRNAALVLGVIGGLLAMLVGFFSYGYTEFITQYGEIEGLAEQVDRVGLIRAVSFLSPLLACLAIRLKRFSTVSRSARFNSV